MIMLAQYIRFCGFQHVVNKNIRFIMYCTKLIKIHKNIGVSTPVPLMSATLKTIISNVNQVQ